MHFLVDKYTMLAYHITRNMQQKKNNFDVYNIAYFQTCECACIWETIIAV